MRKEEGQGSVGVVGDRRGLPLTIAVGTVSLVLVTFHLGQNEGGVGQCGSA